MSGMLVFPPCKPRFCPAASSENSPETALSTKHQGWILLTVFLTEHFLGKGRGEDSPVSRQSGRCESQRAPSCLALLHHHEAVPSPPLCSLLEPEIGCFLDPGPSPAKPWRKPPQPPEPAAYYNWLLMLSLPRFSLSTQVGFNVSPPAT